jgi:hypothetical protein
MQLSDQTPRKYFDDRYTVPRDQDYTYKGSYPFGMESHHIPTAGEANIISSAENRY